MGRNARIGLICLLGLSWCALPSRSEAALETYIFENITGNNAHDAETGETQIFVDVYDASSDPLAGTSNALGAGQVGFRFRNVGPERSSITRVFFEDGALLSMHVPLIGSTGVDFSQDNRPGTLPGGNGDPWNFEPSRGFENVATADADAPLYRNGVNPGEWLIVMFNLEPDKTYDSVIAALAQRPAMPGTGTTLRIGIHVQGFEGGGSEAFINQPFPLTNGVVPEPATFVVWSGLALAGLGAAFRFNRRSR
jgi:hypothetical protein